MRKIIFASLFLIFLNSIYAESIAVFYRLKKSKDEPNYYVMEIIKIRSNNDNNGEKLDSNILEEIEKQFSDNISADDIIFLKGFVNVEKIVFLIKNGAFACGISKTPVLRPEDLESYSSYITGNFSLDKNGITFNYKYIFDSKKEFNTPMPGAYTKTEKCAEGGVVAFNELGKLGLIGIYRLNKM